MKRYFLFILFIFFAPLISHAQDQKNTSAGDIVNYIPATFQNLSFALWSMGAYSTDNDEALDAYLQISNCPLFEAYKEDDFIWQNIREGLRREIDYFADEYPKRFYIDSLVAIDRYDFRKSAFLLERRFQFSDAGSIRFPFYDANAPFCGLDDYWKYFSMKMSFRSDIEFAFMEIPIPPNEANALLKEIMQYHYPSIRNSDRIVPIRFEITVNGYELLDHNNIVFRGDMDRVIAYKDPARTQPIWSRQFKIFE